MTWKSVLALLLPASLRSDAHDEFTRAVAANIHANGRRRTASVRTALAAETRAASMETTIHRIEGRSGERRSAGEAAMQVAEATREFLRKPR